MKKGMSLHLNEINLPKGVTAVTRGKPNPVLVSMVVTGGGEEAEAAEGAVEGAVPVVAAVPAPEVKAPAADKGGKGDKGDKKAPAKKK